jgi:hypothetical protein
MPEGRVSSGLMFGFVPFITCTSARRTARQRPPRRLRAAPAQPANVLRLAAGPHARQPPRRLARCSRCANEGADEGADEGAAHPWRAAASQSRVQLARFADAAAARAGIRLLAGREDYVFARDYEELGQHLVTCRPARHSVKNPGIRVRAPCRRQGMLEPTEQFKDIARQREKILNTIHDTIAGRPNRTS